MPGLEGMDRHEAISSSFWGPKSSLSINWSTRETEDIKRYLPSANFLALWGSCLTNSLTGSQYPWATNWLGVLVNISAGGVAASSWIRLKTASQTKSAWRSRT